MGWPSPLRMRRWGSGLLTLAGVLAPPLIHGQPAPSQPQSQPQAQAQPAAEIPIRRPLFTGTHVGAYASFSEMPGLLLGFNHDSLVFAGGLTLRYEGNGIVDSTGNQTGDRVTSAVTVSAAKLFYNIAPVGMGPALAYSTDVAPELFQRHIVHGSMVFYFAPFEAPVVLVTVLSSRLILERDREPIFELFTPSVLLGYLIY